MSQTKRGRGRPPKQINLLLIFFVLATHERLRLDGKGLIDAIKATIEAARERFPGESLSATAVKNIIHGWQPSKVSYKTRNGHVESFDGFLFPCPTGEKSGVFRVELQEHADCPEFQMWEKFFPDFAKEIKGRKVTVFTLSHKQRAKYRGNGHQITPRKINNKKG